jgi:hypothetical protein
VKLNRSVICMGKSLKNSAEEVATLSQKEALLYVWELTREVYLFTGDFDAQSRLQRDAVSLTRKQG